MAGFEVASKTGEGILTLCPQGELTITTMAVLDRALKAGLTPETAGVVVDASSLTFMDSTGLSALIGIQREGKSRGFGVAFAGFAGAPLRVLETTHMHLVLQIHPSAAEARAALLKK